MVLFRPRLLLANSSRAFSATSRKCRTPLNLAYQVFDPPKYLDITPRSEPIVLMHGLFGSKQNNRSISKALSKELNRTIFTIDLRNHGDSPHHENHTYTAMAEDVESFIHQHRLNKPVLIGHSMGAKTAMVLALQQPQLISALIAVDNAPVDAALSPDFEKYTQAMQSIEAANLTKSSEADQIMQRYEKSLPIRQFLLTNLVRRPEANTLGFRIPVEKLAAALTDMAGFPFKDLDKSTYEGPSLFIRGSRSHYVNDSTLSSIERFFPKFQLRDVAAGHWVMAENPDAFKQVVTEFLN